MHWVTGKPQACEDFRSRFSIYCTTRCGRSTWVKTKKQGPRQNHRTGCLQRSLVEIKRLKQFTKYSAAFTIRPASSPFLWANHGLSLLFSKCVSSRHTWSDTRCLCGILHSVSAHRTLSICFLAVWLFASLVILDSFLPPSIIAHVFFYSYLFIQSLFPFVLQNCYQAVGPYAQRAPGGQQRRVWCLGNLILQEENLTNHKTPRLRLRMQDSLPCALMLIFICRKIKVFRAVWGK